MPGFAFAQALQKNDEGYTAKIRQYTTESFFSTPLVDHLPASDRVPTPEKVLGSIVGAPDKLTYTKDIYRYLRELERTSKRVKVSTIGVSEEGREMLLVAISDEANIVNLDQYKRMTARLADPRATTREEAAALLEQDLPFYWLSGSIHSPETGSPEMLMELAYRLAVEESPLIQNIRRNTVVLITPVVETDGHDREVDVYNYHKAFPDKPAPNLVYWGKYVAHDNNRDGIGMALALSRNMMNAFLDWHPVVLHDLHESEPFLYVSTGTGPYNAWLDPIVIDEWQKMAFHDVEEMTKLGVPGVWTYGYYDGWAPNYMFYVANGHNSIGRFYETFGGAGADTGVRNVPQNATTRTWYRPNPPLPRVNWSLRDNVNLQQSALLISLNYTADHKRAFLENFYAKSQRSVAKATTEGPAAWVLPADDPRPAAAANLAALLQLQGIEVQKTTAEAAVGSTRIPAGSYVIRMDQPYSRMADMLLDTQYYSTSDPAPYDDTGWTLGALHNVKTIRIADTGILKTPMALVPAPAKIQGGLSGDPEGTVYLIDHNAENALMTLRYQLKNVKMSVAEKAFEAAGQHFGAGSLVIRSEGAPVNLRARLETDARDFGLKVAAVAEAPKVAMHDVAAPRIALVHTWTNTQNEGWYRFALDSLKVPYEYISDQKLRAIPDLRSLYDVILFGPTPGTAQRLVNGLPMTGDPIPFQASALTPNLGTAPDRTADMRGGLGLDGMAGIARFVEQGGLFITVGSNASIPIDYGLIEGVSIEETRDLRARGTVVQAVVADAASPIAYGYGANLAVYFNQAPVFRVTPAPGGNGAGAPAPRTSGRGSASDPDVVQGRAPFTPPPPAETPPVPGAAQIRPRVVLRFADENALFVSGMLAGARELAGRPAVVDVPRGQGHVVLFANNPMWRSETQGSYFLLFNAILNFDHLDAGRAQ